MATICSREGKIAILKVDGRLNLGAAVDEFRARWTEALAAGVSGIILDLTDVTMVDSSGIGNIIRCHSAIRGSGGKLQVAGANQTVQQAFRLTRLDKVFEFHPDVATALSSATNTAANAG
jgi:anti-sigma B factor antagonist